jgi:hypothetical protein
MESLMYRVLTIAGALSLTLATAGAALAQAYPAGPGYPPPPPNAGYYPPAAAAPVPPPAAYATPGWDGIHTSGGAARAYSYTGGQKTN